MFANVFRSADHRPSLIGYFYRLALLLILGISSLQSHAQDFNEIIKAVASDRAMGDNFGVSVSISGNYVIICAFREDEDADGMNTLEGAGSAYIFERDGMGNWQEVQKLVASDRAANDRFGYSVSIHWDCAIVGAYQDDEDADGMNTFLEAGSAHIFERDGGCDWQEVAKLVASEIFMPML